MSCDSVNYKLLIKLRTRTMCKKKVRLRRDKAYLIVRKNSFRNREVFKKIKVLKRGNEEHVLELLLEFFSYFFKFSIPIFTKLSNQGIFHEPVNRNLELFPQAAGVIANVPLVVIDSRKF